MFVVVARWCRGESFCDTGIPSKRASRLPGQSVSCVQSDEETELNKDSESSGFAENRWSLPTPHLNLRDFRSSAQEVFPVCALTCAQHKEAPAHSDVRPLWS